MLTALLWAQGPNAAQQRKFLSNLSSAAIERTQHTVRYDPAYVRLPYPSGDVPADTGVCTDEVIRAYRAVGIDLQKEVHEDMAANLLRILESGDGTSLMRISTTAACPT